MKNAQERIDELKIRSMIQRELLGCVERDLTGIELELLEIEETELAKKKKKNSHKWEHGDIFRTRWGVPMICIIIENKPLQVFALDSQIVGPATNRDQCLASDNFLFNITEKL